MQSGIAITGKAVLRFGSAMQKPERNAVWLRREYLKESDGIHKQIADRFPMYKDESFFYDQKKKQFDTVLENIEKVGRMTKSKVIGEIVEKQQKEDEKVRAHLQKKRELDEEYLLKMQGLLRKREILGVLRGIQEGHQREKNEKDFLHYSWIMLIIAELSTRSLWKAFTVT